MADIEVHDGITSNGIFLSAESMQVFMGGTAINTTVDQGGKLIVDNGGLAKDTVLYYGGSADIQGTASNVKVQYGASLELLAGGKLNVATVFDGGSATVHADGRASGVIIDGG